MHQSLGFQKMYICMGLPPKNFENSWDKVRVNLKKTVFYWIDCSEYEALEVLGRGLSSVVRRCRHRENGHEYAVKIIDLLQEESPNTAEIQNEIALLKEFAGVDYVIHLFDVYQTETYVFMVFELMKVTFNLRA